jgi:adenosylmethionine-8-amino-7-oxononanoate aminotransferase
MNEWLKKDLEYNWHPYTQMSLLAQEPPLLIERALGIKLYDADGRWYYDTISSWWSNVHGHGQPRIRDAVARQMSQLDHVLFASVTHRPAIELAERLVHLAPRGLRRVFYSDNGSTAVEVALKMSLQYWKNAGLHGKTKFVGLERGYHGDTIGCMSVSGVERFHAAFAPVLCDVFRVPTPYCYRCPVGLERPSCNTECTQFLEDVLAAHAGEIAAVILEPLLLAAGGMITYPAQYLSRAAQLAAEHGVHLIVDEVATGFGRTGTMFACEQAGVSPDFLCLSKGITSGTLPFAATLTTAEVYNAFLGSAQSDRTFYHGHTYTANPVGCAAALASLDLFEENRTLEHARELSALLIAETAGLRSSPHVGDVRCIGTVAGFELVNDKVTRAPLDCVPGVLAGIRAEGLKRQIILRPLANVVYLFLPLCTSTDELRDIVRRLEETIAAAFSA